KDSSLHDHHPSQGKRAVRRGTAPLQAHHRKAGSADRTARTRVLRKADRRAQAQEGCGRQAPLQARSQHAAAQEALLRVSREPSTSFPSARRPGAEPKPKACTGRRSRLSSFQASPARRWATAPDDDQQQGTPMSLKQRINDDMKAAMRAKEADRLLAI